MLKGCLNSRSVMDHPENCTIMVMGVPVVTPIFIIHTRKCPIFPPVFKIVRLLVTVRWRMYPKIVSIFLLRSKAQ